MRITRTPFKPHREHWIVGDKHFDNTAAVRKNIDSLDLNGTATYAYELEPQKDSYTPGERAANAVSGGIAGVIVGGVAGGGLAVANHILGNVTGILSMAQYGPGNFPTAADAIPLLIGGVAIGAAVGTAFGALSSPPAPETYFVQGPLTKSGDTTEFHPNVPGQGSESLSQFPSKNLLVTAAADDELQAYIQKQFQ